MIIEKYNPELICIKCSHILVADALSRLELLPDEENHIKDMKLHNVEVAQLVKGLSIGNKSAIGIKRVGGRHYQQSTVFLGSMRAFRQMDTDFREILGRWTDQFLHDL